MDVTRYTYSHYQFKLFLKKIQETRRGLVDQREIKRQLKNKQNAHFQRTSNEDILKSSDVKYEKNNNFH